MGPKISRGELVAIAAGALALGASFLPFYKNGESITIWDTRLFPVGTLIPILTGVSALLIVANRAERSGPSRRVAGFSLDQLALVASFEAAVLAWAFFVVRRGGYGIGVGYVLLLIAALGSLIGAFLIVNEKRLLDTTVGRRTRALSQRGRVSPGELLIVVGALVALVGSLLPFYEIESFSLVDTIDFTLWSRDFPLLFPVATLILVYALAAAFSVAVARLDTGPAAGGMLGFRASQLSLAASAGAALLALAFLVQDKGALAPGAASIDFGLGYYLLLVACVASTVGAVLLHLAGTRAEAV